MSTGIQRECFRIILKNNHRSIWNKRFDVVFCLGHRGLWTGRGPKHDCVQSQPHRRKGVLIKIHRVCGSGIRSVRGFVETTTQKRTCPPFRVLFFGTDQYALHHLKALHANQLEGRSAIIDNLDVAVCTEKSSVKRYADTHELTTHSWPLPDLRGKYDVGVIVSFGHLIPARVINSFPFGVLNVHPSLLPAWRGAAPLITTVLSGATTSGISVMSIHPKKFDTGPLLAQKIVTVPDRVTSFGLVNHMAQYGTSMLLECLANIKTLPQQPQSEESPTPRAHKIKPCNAYINWDKQCVVHIDRQYRALSELLPLRTQWKNGNIKLLDMVSPDLFQVTWNKDLPDSTSPGSALYHKPSDTLCIRCKDGWVGFRRVVHKKAMSALAFYNGYLSQRGSQLVTFTSQQNGLDYFWR